MRRSRFFQMRMPASILPSALALSTTPTPVAPPTYQRLTMGPAVDGLAVAPAGGAGVWAEAGAAIPKAEIKTSNKGTRCVIQYLQWGAGLMVAAITPPIRLREPRGRQKSVCPGTRGRSEPGAQRANRVSRAAVR